MNKKAQFYLFTAIILIGIAFSLVQAPLGAREINPLFTQLTTNLHQESVITVNNALYKDKSVENEYNSFFRKYMIYAKTRDPKFEAVYLLKTEDNVTIYSEMKDSLQLANPSKFIDPKAEKTISFELINATTKDEKKPTITIDGVAYRFDFDIGSDDVELKVLARSVRQNEKRIKILDIN